MHCSNLQVVDTGIGIKREVQESIFESFSQADNSISRSHGGTGLGLAISKRLVEMMGGTIHLASEEGNGTNSPLPLGWLSVKLVIEAVSLIPEAES